eukprot:TRINITY_DN903_c0_g1_i1.p1 TRINITY_DN903_c0_g1~~TRINITY_DN903_c0_g1_i1.p1  ORF type:complete len:972 (-),score=286.61 TRINITY_DN903_c0_g1_i1:125-3040(-)
MGNQQGKQSKRAAHGQTFPFDEPEKKSRTDWTAGVPLAPGRPMVQLSSRTEPQDENSVTDEINITWAVPKDDGGFPITGYRIEMLDIQTNNWIEITFIEGFEPRCTLSNILYGIMYRFRVIAYNDAGPSEPGDPSDPVVIDVPGVQIAPYFVLMLNDTIALEHEKVEFKVKVLGTPKPSVQWFKDDMEVFSSDRLEIKEEEDGGSVIVKEARLNDSGNIKCVATNVLGRATSVAQLTIEASPRLDIPENYNDGLIFRYDEVIRLKIPLIAKPPPRITWFFDDEPICPSEDVQIETTEVQTSLRIGAAKRWHCGEFRVLAQNENGEDAASILVTVTAPPSPAGKPVVIDISGTTCVLRWDPIQDDGGADVKHYIVEYFRDVWDVWLKARTTKDCEVGIEDLIPGSRYKFRIKAENAYGISEESEESDAFDVGGVQPQETRNPTISVSEDASSWSDVASPPPSLAATKGEWVSEDATEDVLNNLLRVKKLSQRVSSIESDGLPSMASIDVGDDNLSLMSESSDLQRARKMYEDLQAMSMESAAGSQEDMPDLDAYAREFYNEIRALSMDTGGSIENILDNIGASSESLTSLIPHNKRQELASFEMSLKQMIDEAKMLAESPGQSMEDISMRRRSDTRTPVIEMEERRSRKSFSQISHPDSVVSVIEAEAVYEEEEPLPMSQRGVPKKISPHVMEDQPPITYKLEEQDSLEEQAPPPPLEELEPPPVAPVRTSPKVTPQPPPGRRGQVVNREPSVGSDRYEEIIVETRKRSLSRTGSRMGSRTSSVLDFKTSQNDFKTSNASIGKLDLESIRASTKNVAALDLDNKITKITPPKPMTPDIPKKPLTPEVSKSPAPIIQKVPAKAPVSKSPPKTALDGNQNATAPSLPVVPPVPRKLVEPDPLVKMFPKNIPHWFVITYTYSVVLIMILLIANVTPDGKLYIHFTAFWSLILYFVLEDDQASDLLDTVVEGFLKK